MIIATYTDPEVKYEINSILEDEDTNLTETFARFVELTRMVGYQSGSWKDLIAKISEIEDLFDWASAVIYE